MLCFLLLSHCALFLCLYLVLGHFEKLSSFFFFFWYYAFLLSLFYFRLQVEGVDNALIKGEIESQWTGLIALLV